MVGDITQNSVKLISFTLFLFAIFFLQAYFTSSKVTYTVNQLVMCILVQIWAFYNDAF